MGPGSSDVVTASAVVAETIAKTIAAAHATATQRAIKLNQKRFCLMGDIPDGVASANA